VLNDCEVNAIERLAALTVSIALPAEVTEFGEIPHVGIGAGPLTEHVSTIVPEKPPCAGNVSVSFACPPRLTVRLCADAFTAKSGETLNVAVTLWLVFTMTVHAFGSAPVHAPFQPAKVELAEGLAVSA
jgi:hypothetical protein